MRENFYIAGKIKPATVKCTGYSYPSYPIQESACGLRILPLKFKKRGCSALNYKAFQTTITAIEPSTISDPQRGHVYIGTELNCSDSIRRDLSEPTVMQIPEWFYVEAGIHAQPSKDFGNRVAGLYLRVAPNEWIGQAILRAAGLFGYRSSSGKPASQTVHANDVGYLVGPDAYRGRFMIRNNFPIRFSYRMIATPVAGRADQFQTKLQAIARGVTMDRTGHGDSEESADKIELNLLKVQSTSANKAVNKVMTQCRMEQRLVLGADWGADRMVKPTDTTQQFRLKNTLFTGIDGRKLDPAPLLLHYPLSPTWKGISCMDVEVNEFKWTSPNS